MKNIILKLEHVHIANIVEATYKATCVTDTDDHTTRKIKFSFGHKAFRCTTLNLHMNKSDTIARELQTYFDDIILNGAPLTPVLSLPIELCMLRDGGYNFTSTRALYVDRQSNEKQKEEARLHGRNERRKREAKRQLRMMEKKSRERARAISSSDSEVDATAIVNGT